MCNVETRAKEEPEEEVNNSSSSSSSLTSSESGGQVEYIGQTFFTKLNGFLYCVLDDQVKTEPGELTMLKLILNHTDRKHPETIKQVWNCLDDDLLVKIIQLTEYFLKNSQTLATLEEDLKTILVDVDNERKIGYLCTWVERMSLGYLNELLRVQLIRDNTWVDELPLAALKTPNMETLCLFARQPNTYLKLVFFNSFEQVCQSFRSMYNSWVPSLKTNYPFLLIGKLFFDHQTLKVTEFSGTLTTSCMGSDFRLTSKQKEKTIEKFRKALITINPQLSITSFIPSQSDTYNSIFFRIPVNENEANSFSIVLPHILHCNLHNYSIYTASPDKFEDLLEDLENFANANLDTGDEVGFIRNFHTFFGGRQSCVSKKVDSSKHQALWEQLQRENFVIFLFFYFLLYFLLYFLYFLFPFSFF